MPGAPSAPGTGRNLVRAAHGRARIIPEPAPTTTCPDRVALVASARRPAFARGLVREGRPYFAGARHVCSHLEQLRKRYAEDEEFRQKKIAYACAYYKAHKEEIHGRRRRRRKTEPAHRQKLLATGQAYYEAHKKEISERRRRRRQTDPEHRDKLLA